MRLASAIRLDKNQLWSSINRLEWLHRHVSWHAALHILILIDGYIISAASYPAVILQLSLGSGKGTQKNPIAPPRKAALRKTLR